MTASRPCRRRAAGPRLCAALLTLALIGTACTTARNELGTEDSSCYLALPVASHAVHAQGRLLGVERFTLATLRKQTPHLYADLHTRRPANQRVCVVAYGGRFQAARVEMGHGRAAGRLAVVVATFPDNHLLGTVIFFHAPLTFGHSHIG